MNPTQIFLDFDGVLCDSVQECFVSSRLAYRNETNLKAVDSTPQSVKEKFYSYRPLIRTGADYVLLQEALDKDIPLTGQKEFDDLQELRGPETMSAYREAFYSAREYLLKNHRDYWISLNPLFECFIPGLKAAAGNTVYTIISTKKNTFIAEILDANEIRWPIERIIDSGKKRKLSIIGEYVTDTDRTLFVDDQIDHLIGNSDPRIEPKLAEWGYIKDEWLKQTDVETISKEELLALLP
jgi:phosphoglycolate phosphatase-like HAD superfamily hydrolase